MKFLLAFALLIPSAFAQQGLSGAAGINGWPQNVPVISAVTQSSDALTVVLGWTTNIASDSRGSCGSETGADNAMQSLTTTHQVVVAGLVPSTGYTCTVQSGSTTATIAATTTASATSTPITGIAVGTATKYGSGVNCDTTYNFESNDGNTYFICDDIDPTGFSGAQNSAVGLNKFTTIPTAAIQVNALSGYGNCCTLTTPDGLSPKGQGLFGMAGNLFMMMNRQQQGQTSFDLQFSPTILESTNHGTSWNNFQAPGTYASTGTNNSPVTMTPFSFASSPTNFAASSFVVYGADDGTNGYLVAANRVDNGNAYVYGISNNRGGSGSTWNNGDHLYLWRTSRANLLNAGTLNAPFIQCWVSGDGSLDANWTANLANCGAVITNTGEISLANMQYIPALNRYLLLTFYYPAFGTTSSSVWLAYDCAHPWQCNSTPVSTITSATIGVSGAYNPVIIQADALAATFGSTTMHVLFTSDFKATYDVYYATLTASH